MNILFALLLNLSANVNATNATDKPSFEQYINSAFNSAYSAEISADGQVAYLSRVSGTAQVWKTNLKGEWPTQLTFLDEPVEPPEWTRRSHSWSPDGKWLSFTVNAGGAQKNQIYLMNESGGEMQKISADPKAMHRLGPWSPDGKMLSWTSNERDNKVFDVYVVDVKTKAARRLYESQKSLDVLDWSPDGKCLLVRHLVSDIIHNLLVVNVESGTERLITPHEGEAQYDGVFGNSCDTVFALTDEGVDFKGLAKIDVAKASKTWLVQKNGDADHFALSRKKNEMVVAWNSAGYSELKRYDLAGKAKTVPALPKALYRDIHYSKDGGNLVFTYAGPRERPAIHGYRFADGKSLTITRPSMAGLVRGDLVEPKIVHYKSFDGADISGLLFEPKESSDKKRPAVIAIHGGPEDQARPYFAATFQYLVSQGFTVFAPNIRGSTGYGKKFNQMDNGAKRPDAMQDILKAHDYLVENGLADAKKIAITGGSYGGYAVLYMVTHFPDRWAAAVDECGMANFESFFKNTSPARVPLRALEYGDPVKDKDLLREISPLSKVNEIQTPMMIIQGANDPIVPKIESDQIAESLKKRGRPVEYLVFPDEGHGLSKRQNILKALPAQVQFLRKYLETPESPK